MDAKNLNELNLEFMERRLRKKEADCEKPAPAAPRASIAQSFPNALFWVAACMLMLALLQCWHGSHHARPVFGYSLYLEEAGQNLLLVKSGHGHYASRKFVDGGGEDGMGIGVVKAESARLGKLVSFMESKAHFAVFAAALWGFVAIWPRGRKGGGAWGLKG